MLSHRNRARLRRFGRKFVLQGRPCHCQSGDCVNLSLLPTGTEATITCNNDLKTIERGLYHGKKVTVFRGEPGEPNMVIAVGDARYVLDRRVASQIMVRVS